MISAVEVWFLGVDAFLQFLELLRILGCVLDPVA